MHYTRWHRHGSPTATPRKTPNEVAIAFLMDHLSFRSEECLFWPFDAMSNGYARITFRGKRWSAANLVCTLVNGPAPDGHEAAHSCGNGHKGCISPIHIRWRTRSQNQMERVLHGTANRGSRHGIAKLKEQDVRKIERLLVKGEAQQNIANKFGVSQGAVADINLGKTWGWLTGRGQCRATG